jgi:uncharacterized repeat protein (TIGR03806 family)
MSQVEYAAEGGNMRAIGNGAAARTLMGLWVGVLATTTAATEPVRKPWGIEKRDLWTTGNLQGTPEPPSPYQTENAFPKVRFVEPLSVGVVPATNRFGVGTRPGKIYTFEIRPDVEQANLLLDLEKSTYGIAFHPQFAENGYLFVTYIDPPLGDKGSRLSRFTVRKDERGQLVAERSSEKLILEWPFGGHNGGCIRFGPDGMLYLATGDGSGIADGLETGQKIDDLLGSILRIDVDHADGERAYAIPADNPFVTREGARGEIWSFGHRQVWKFAFDQPTKQLWACEVGQDLWEMVYLIRRGGNYGWSVREGRHPFRPQRPIGPAPLEEPIAEQPHSDFRSITGGYVYRGSARPELTGAYIYGDYDSGKLWMLRYDGPPAGGGRVTEHRELADTQLRIVEFAQDPSGEVYAVDFVGGGFHKLVPAPPIDTSKPFPQKLSETGLFASTKDHTPAQGLIPYSVNAQLWSDGAEKERFLALPGDSQIELDDVVYPHGQEYPDPGWRFPDGTALVKTFSLDLKPGEPASRRRLETRVLQYRKMPGNDDEYGAQFWFGYTYVWNDEQTDAELLGPAGLDREFVVVDKSLAEGKRIVNWRFPSRSECALCHTMAAKYALGVTTLQLNKDHVYHDAGGGTVANQLATLEHLGIFTAPLPQRPEKLPRLVDDRDPKQDLHLRARSYLHANCAHCHRKWGGGNAEFELHASSPLTALGVVNTAPGQGTFNLPEPKVLVPGDPARSLVLRRMELTGLGRMPHIASRVVDRHGVKLIREWLAALRDEQLLTRPGAVNPRLQP